MRVLRDDPDSWRSTITAGSAISIGVFDGVHRGHQSVLADLRDRAIALGRLPLVVVTFDEHPLRVVAPDAAPRMLTSEEQRLELFEDLGIDVVALLPFRTVRNFTPDEFIRSVLVDGFAARLVAVGLDFRFGRDRAGDVSTLVAAGREHSFEVDAVELLQEYGHPLSSSEIRIMVAAGRVEEAATALGRLFELRGAVVAGDGRGRQIGFPTANLDLQTDMAVPGRGVYAGLASIDDTFMPGAANVGVRPTFDGEREVVEVHVIGLDADLYGRTLALRFHSRIRDERRFAGVEELAAQIESDVAEAGRRLEAADD